jgi:excisionase family DNA binding protein
VADLAPVGDERLLTPDDVAKRLSVSRSMIYTLVRRGDLRALRIGRLPRVTETDLAAYLAAAGRCGTPETRR